MNPVNPTEHTESENVFRMLGKSFVRFAKRNWLPTLVVIVVLVAIHGIAMLIMGRRFEAEVQALKAKGEPVSYAALGGPKVPDDQNAAMVYAKAFELLEGKKTLVPKRVLEEMLRSEGVISARGKRSPTDWPDVKQAAAMFRGVVPLTQEALSRPQCQFPVDWAAGWGARFPHYSKLRSLVQVLLAQALVAAHDGRQDEAFRLIGMCFRVSKASKDEPILISTLVTIACIQMSNNALQAVLKYGLPSDAQMVELHNLLADTDFRAEWVNGVRGDRASGLLAFKNIISGGAYAYSQYGGIPDYGYYSQTSRSLMQLASVAWKPMLYADGGEYLKYMAVNVDLAKLPYRSIVQQEKRIQASLGELPRYAIITRQVAPIFTQGSARVDQARANTGLTQILLAALQYKARTGRYPNSITQLRLKATWELPLDPFSGKEFVYKRTSKGFLAYSIGADLKDDRGKPVKSGTEWIKGGDIVLNWER